MLCDGEESVVVAPKPRLLDRLRRHTVGFVYTELTSYGNGGTSQEAAAAAAAVGDQRSKVNASKKETARLIVEHQSEFPTKLRSDIAEAAATATARTTMNRSRTKDLSGCFPVVPNNDFVDVDVDVDVFLEEVYRSVKRFFVTPRVLRGDPNNPLVEWVGPDKDVDTEEEIELVLRLFPKVLHERVQRLRFTELEMVEKSVFVSSAKAVAFVPLLLKVACDLGAIEDDIWLPRKYLDRLLVNRDERSNYGSYTETDNGFVRSDEGDCVWRCRPEEPSRDLDENSLRALRRMREVGLVTEEDIKDSLLRRLFVMTGKSKPKDLSNAFFERRMRLLIEWSPSILKNHTIYEDGLVGDTNNDLLHLFFGLNHFRTDSNLGMALFRVIFELGMAHYPDLLGFLFHLSNLTNYCEWLGPKAVTAIIDDTMFRALNKQQPQSSDRALQAWLFEAATNDRISLDGVYTLIRYNPLALVRGS